MAYELNTLNDEKLLQYKSRRKKEKGKLKRRIIKQ